MQRVRAHLVAGSRTDLFAASDIIIDVAAADLRSLLSDVDLSQQLRRHRAATIGRVADLARRCCRHRLDEALATVAAGADGGSRSSRKRATADRSWVEPDVALYPEIDIERLSHLTMERVLVHAAAPPIQLSPIAGPPPPAICQDARIVAVVFDSPLAIGHELYPLWTDAFATGRIEGRPTEVVGVHLSWLNETCQATRLISYDVAQDVFREETMSHPCTLDAAVILAQGSSAHGDLSRRLQSAGIPHVNEYTATASQADDKWACYTRWCEAKVSTPPTCLLEQGAHQQDLLAAVAEFVEACDQTPSGWYVQPRHGTESGGVEWIPVGDAERGTPRFKELYEQIVKAVRQMTTADDAIVRPAVGHLQLPTADGPRGFDLRLHTCRQAGATAVESGYIICAQSPNEPVVAISRGARIERLAQLSVAGLAGVDETGEEIEVPWTPDLQSRVFDVAAAAAATLDLDLAGVDLKLDLLEQQVVPVVLDVNPRPAGLLHADLISTDPPEPGIGASVWRRLAGA